MMPPMLYDKLNQDMRDTVDAYVGRMGPLEWRRRSELLVEAAGAFGEDLAPEKSSLAARGFVTAVIERLGAPEVDDPHQASLYMASLDAGHRALAERFLEQHPRLKAMIDGQLSEES